LESLSERDPYALSGARDYLPLSYDPRYFGARLCHDLRDGRPRHSTAGNPNESRLDLSTVPFDRLID
jgi:hypothetical protein